MKRAIIFLLFFLIVFFGFTKAQTVSFSAKAKNSGKPVTLDSVKIINLTSQKETIIYSTEFNFDWFNGVNHGSSAKSDELSVSAYSLFGNEGDYKIKVNMPADGMLYVSVYNRLGARVLGNENYVNAGSSEFVLHSGNLSGGIYFVTAGNGFNINTAKLMINGSGKVTSNDLEFIGTSGTIVRNAKQKNITSSDLYRFIGFSKKYSPCVIDSVYPTNNNNYEFMLKIEIPTIFNTCNVSLTGIKANVQVNRSWYQSGGSSGSSTDTTEIDLDIIYSFIRTHYSWNPNLMCFGDTNNFFPRGIGFTCNVLTFSGETFYCKGGSIVVVIDTNKQMFSDIYISYNTGMSYRGALENNYVRETTSFTYKNVPFTIDDNQSLHVELLNDLDFEFVIISNINYRYSNEYSYHATGNSVSRSLINFFTGSAGKSLTITLSP
ncbi:MAG: hypothetical protein WCT77_12605 [Bacteroidota bacterium]